jgi:ArsR family transcriptional regulator
MDSDTAVKQLDALAQDSRLALFRCLVKAGAEGLTAGELASACNLAATSVSFHAKELLNAGLVTSRQEGRFVHYTATLPAMNSLMKFLTDNCCGGKAC